MTGKIYFPKVRKISGEFPADYSSPKFGLNIPVILCHQGDSEKIDSTK